MKLTPEIIRLVCDLEYRIGWWCNNPRWGGSEDGLDFRYPVRIMKACADSEEDEEIKIDLRIPESAGLDAIRGAFYKFGSNHLQIGEAIIDVLQWMEDRYGLDFSEMEKSAHSIYDYETNDSELVDHMRQARIYSETLSKDADGTYHYVYKKTPEFMTELDGYRKLSKR